MDKQRASDPLDLKALAKEILDGRKVGPGELAVCGGRCWEDGLLDFLNSWPFPRGEEVWWLCRWAHRVRFFHGGMAGGRFSAPPAAEPEIEALGRLRVFGAPGDLELRRERTDFQWRFVGDPAAAPVGSQAFNYWDSGRSAEPLSKFERTALLWGEYATDLGSWHDDRVGSAILDYPGVETEEKPPSVVEVLYTEYLDGGNIELVRFRGLQPGPDRKEVQTA